MKINIQSLNEFKNELVKSKKTLNTIIAYITDLRQFERFYTGDMEDLLTEDVERWQQSFLDRGITPKSINRKLISLKRYIDFINNRPEYGVRILAVVRCLRVQRQWFLKEPLTKGEFDRMVRAAEEEKDLRAVALFYTLYLTGGRISEVLQLRVSSIEKISVSVRGKGDKYRDLLLSDQLREQVEKYVEDRAPGEYLFKNKANDRPISRQTAANIIKRYAGKCKIKLQRAHLHNLRHLFALKLLAEGVPPTQLADMLGHESVDTTRIYTQLPKEQLLKILNKI